MQMWLAVSHFCHVDALLAIIIKGEGDLVNVWMHVMQIEIGDDD